MVDDHYLKLRQQVLDYTSEQMREQIKAGLI